MYQPLHGYNSKQLQFGLIKYLINRATYATFETPQATFTLYS